MIFESLKQGANLLSSLADNYYFDVNELKGVKSKELLEGENESIMSSEERR